MGYHSGLERIKRRRKSRGHKPPLPLPLANRPGVKELDVTPHQLEDYKPGSRDDGSES